MTLYALDGAAPEVPEDGDFWVAPNASVIGGVKLGAGASVWFAATLRSDTEAVSVGAGSNVQDGAVVHADPGFPARIGENVTVGHQAIVHGASIGAGSLVGMQAVVLNGARIGEGCLIGAGAVVTEGKEIPAGHLALGAPARAVRELSKEEKASLLDTARRYRSNMRRFRDGLTPL